MNFNLVVFILYYLDYKILNYQNLFINYMSSKIAFTTSFCDQIASNTKDFEPAVHN